VLSIAVTAFIVPVAGAAGPAGDAGLPDLWSGIWPAQLMDGSTITPLGTLTWKQIRYTDGVAAMGKNFGGQPFAGCPDDARTRFFRGHYVEGGDLIACTRGEDTKELYGRFNGREDFRSGSFVIRMISDGFFQGKYDEDGGITTMWCGKLQQRLAFSPVKETIDMTAPRLSMRIPSQARVGARVPIRLAAREDGARAGVDLSFLVGAKPLQRMNGVPVRPDGTVRVVSWRVPAAARGKLRVCAAAFDRVGNASKRTCASVRVR